MRPLLSDLKTADVAPSTDRALEATETSVRLGAEAVRLGFGAAHVPDTTEKLHPELRQALVNL